MMGREPASPLAVAVGVAIGALLALGAGYLLLLVTFVMGDL